MKLYYSKGSCSLAIRILIHELGLNCEFEAVNFATKQTENGKNYLEINPKGSVPVLQLNEDTFLTENAVIHQYLADGNKANHLLPPVGNFQRYRVLEKLNYVATEIHKGTSPLWSSQLPQQIKDEIFIPIMKKKLDYLDKHFAENQFISGNEYTLPDGYLFVTLNWFPHFKIDLSQWNHVKRYYDAMKNRPAVQKALQEEGLV